ncbi:RNA-binding protein [Trypanosoma theileri]|uniref:60S ribosome subunit biogenesis protein NIP7 homolog n=1 Tax=Trypanosoma theileri TaxID=67003 RepID=A0A1X0P123_9TRYP|nr:RNA-binding protein [Trypanosoma theileri]ORC90595.1 RNA-binding protein [Trypanosoma theileri]
MRPLTEEETKKLFEKLAQYIGPNTTRLLQSKNDHSNHDNNNEQQQDEEHVFRLHKGRIWYMPLRLAKLASCVSKSNLMGIGVLFAKVTHNGHIRIQVTALDYIAQYSLFKVWVKPNQEQKFLYGGHITRAGLGRITESTPKYQKVAVFSMGDIPLGFGVAALGTVECRRCEMNATVLFHEADVGEYLRNEARLT